MKQRLFAWLAVQLQKEIAAMIAAEVERQLAKTPALPVRKRYIGQ